MSGRYYDPDGDPTDEAFVKAGGFRRRFHALEQLVLGAKPLNPEGALELARLERERDEARSILRDAMPIIEMVSRGGYPHGALARAVNARAHELLGGKNE